MNYIFLYITILIIIATIRIFFGYKIASFYKKIFEQYNFNKTHIASALIIFSGFAHLFISNKSFSFEFILTMIFTYLGLTIFDSLMNDLFMKEVQYKKESNIIIEKNNISVKNQAHKKIADRVKQGGGTFASMKYKSEIWKNETKKTTPQEENI